METQERILTKSYELFMRYGIRSVSMDDIAYHLGISKKTIYQFYADKDTLVEGVLDIEIQRNFRECESHKKNKENAVHQIFLSLDEMQEMFTHLNPTIVHDIQKYHPRVFKILNQHKENFIYTIIKENLENGIKEGLYRPEINIDILTKFHIESIFLTFNTEIYPSSKYNLTEVSQEILENFLYGIVSIKGVKKIQQYKRQRQKPISYDQKTA